MLLQSQIKLLADSTLEMDTYLYDSLAKIGNLRESGYQASQTTRLLEFFKNYKFSTSKIVFIIPNNYCFQCLKIRFHEKIQVFNIKNSYCFQCLKIRFHEKIQVFNVKKSYCFQCLKIRFHEKNTSFQRQKQLLFPRFKNQWNFTKK